MKLARSKVLIFLLVLGLIVVYANLVSSYVNQKKTQVSLQDQIDTSVKTLSLLPSAPVNSQTRMEEAQKAYNAALAGISDNVVESTQVMESVIKTAAECNIKVNPASTDQWIEKSLGLTTYRILPLTFEIQGTPSAIITFIQRLEDRDQFPNLAIESLTLTEAPLNPENTENSQQQATLNTNLMIRLAPKS